MVRWVRYGTRLGQPILCGCCPRRTPWSMSHQPVSAVHRAANIRRSAAYTQARLPPRPKKRRSRMGRTLPTKQDMARSQQTPLTMALESFLRARWDLKPRTKVSYAKSIRRFMRVHQTIGELTADNVNDFLAAS